MADVAGTLFLSRPAIKRRSITGTRDNQAKAKDNACSPLCDAQFCTEGRAKFAVFSRPFRPLFQSITDGQAIADPPGET